MVETRRAPRFRVTKAAKIGIARDARSCIIRDLSETGAAIEIENPKDVPDEFTLDITEDNLKLPCRVVWRAQFRIGVAFE
ncbi:MAG: PilZ domain-containing protein [Rhizobiales bacterium]|nr:PilZ domain-containing protein [Hyphomicrobiales bacterium]